MRVHLKSWEDGFSVIDTCKMLVASTTLNLFQAKRLCEALLDGEQPFFEIETNELENDLIESLRHLHIKATIE